MSTSAKAVRFDDDSMWVDLDDGRRMAVPLAWFPRLLSATQEQRAQFELSPRGIHWEALDEDISIDGLLAGHGDRTHGRLVVPARGRGPSPKPQTSREIRTTGLIGSKRQVVVDNRRLAGSHDRRLSLQTCRPDSAGPATPTVHFTRGTRPIR